jgi:hypothetical protein
MQHSARQWMLRALLCCPLAGLSSCMTRLLWKEEVRTVESSAGLILPSEFLAAPGLQKIGLNLERYGSLLHGPLPFLRDTPTLWIESVDDGVLERCLHRAAAAGGGLDASCQITLARGFMFHDVDCTLELAGDPEKHRWMADEPRHAEAGALELAVRIPCRVTASSGPLPSGECPLRVIKVSARSTISYGLPLGVQIALTPVTVVFDAVMLPFELLALWYMAANMY